MANFDPAAARWTILYVRRRDPVAPGNSGVDGGWVYDELKYHLVRYDTDTPGESKQYFEPDSDANFSLQKGGGAEGLDIGNYSPYEQVLIADVAPGSDVMRID